MRRSNRCTNRLLPIAVSSIIVGALACSDFASAPQNGSHEFSHDIGAEAAFSAILSSQAELRTTAGRYSSRVSRSIARITTNGDRNKFTTSPLGDPIPREPESAVLVPPPVLASARIVGSDTTMVINKTIDGKRHRVMISGARGKRRGDRPARVFRYVDDKLVDALEFEERQIGGR
jgi:hypothetical protein